MPANMTIRVVRKLSCIEDLIGLEKCLREMYHTADGAICQALMTLAYKCWRNSVVRQLQSIQELQEQDTEKQILDAYSDDVELLWHLPGSVQVFLCGYKIVYARQLCSISQLLPAMCAEKQHKRHSTANEIDSRQEESINVFKKHRLCPSPPQV
jgi:hypothetical protein